jgi:hypothetical protein
MIHKKPKVFVLIGYGEESQTFIRCRPLWSKYIEKHEVCFYFNTLAEDLDVGIIREIPGEIQVGVKGLIPQDVDSSSYGQNYVWSNFERIRFLYRRIQTFKYLLEKEKDPFWVFGTTVTSAVSLKRLTGLLDRFDCANFLGGAPIFKDIPFTNSKFIIVSGASTLISSDLVKLTVDRSEYNSWSSLDDVWNSIILSDVPRSPLMRFDFTDANLSCPPLDIEKISSQIGGALDGGHFHFRVKTGNPLIRQDIDPLIIGKIFDSIDVMEDSGNIDIYDAWKKYASSISPSGSTSIEPII